jgi:hypothetical protein
MLHKENFIKPSIFEIKIKIKIKIPAKPSSKIRVHVGIL